MASTFATFKRLKDKGIAALKQGDYVVAKLLPTARSAYCLCYDCRVEEDRYNPEIHDAPHDDEHAGQDQHD